MNDMFQCGDPGALVAYLYDECEPGERELIAAHITRCATCASEIDTLGATRRTLAAWTPPEMALGFQITRSNDTSLTATQAGANQAGANQAGRVLEPKIAWWRAPLPAWAQAAAAVVIFAAGVSIGVARNATTVQTSSRDAGVVPDTTATETNVSRQELAQLEQRLRAEMSQVRTVSSPGPVPARNADAVMSDVRALIEQSNAEQNRDFTLRLVELASDFDLRNRRVMESVGQLQGAVRTEFGQQRQVNQQLINRVSER